MLFQRSSANLSGLKTLFCLLLLSVAATQAQTAPAAPAQDTSSSSDVQQAQVVSKPKDLYTRDVTLLGFGQDSGKTNGNSIRNGTTSSGGGMLIYRQSPRWWFGYEATYGYTKFTDTYYDDTYRVKHTNNELTLAYLMKSPDYRGYRVFGTLGAGIMSMDPVQYGGIVVLYGKPVTQTVPMFLYTIGVERRITQRISARVQYRDDVYKDPDFKQPTLDTTRLRSSKVPGVGISYRF